MYRKIPWSISGGLKLYNVCQSNNVESDITRRLHYTNIKEKHRTNESAQPFETGKSITYFTEKKSRDDKIKRKAF